MRGFFNDFDDMFQHFTGHHQQNDHHRERRHSNERNHQNHYHHINLEGNFY